MYSIFFCVLFSYHKLIQKYMLPMRQLTYDFIIRDRNFKWVVVGSGLDMTVNARWQGRRPRYKAADHVPNFDTLVLAQAVAPVTSNNLFSNMTTLERQLWSGNESVEIRYVNGSSVTGTSNSSPGVHCQRFRFTFKDWNKWIPVVNREFALQQKIYIYRFTHMSNTLWSLVFEFL